MFGRTRWACPGIATRSAPATIRDSKAKPQSRRHSKTAELPHARPTDRPATASASPSPADRLLCPYSPIQRAQTPPVLPQDARTGRGPSKNGWRKACLKTDRLIAAGPAGPGRHQPSVQTGRAPNSRVVTRTNVGAVRYRHARSRDSGRHRPFPSCVRRRRCARAKALRWKCPPPSP